MNSFMTNSKIIILHQAWTLLQGKPVLCSNAPQSSAQEVTVWSANPWLPRIHDNTQASMRIADSWSAAGTSPDMLRSSSHITSHHTSHHTSHIITHAAHIITQVSHPPSSPRSATLAHPAYGIITPLSALQCITH